MVFSESYDQILLSWQTIQKTKNMVLVFMILYCTGCIQILNVLSSLQLILYSLYLWRTYLSPNEASYYNQACLDTLSFHSRTIRLIAFVNGLSTKPKEISGFVNLILLRGPRSPLAKLEHSHIHVQCATSCLHKWMKTT